MSWFHGNSWTTRLTEILFPKQFFRQILTRNVLQWYLATTIFASTSRTFFVDLRFSSFMQWFHEIFFYLVILMKMQSQSAQSENWGNSLLHLTKFREIKLPKSWFDEIFLVRVNLSIFHCDMYIIHY